MQKPSAFFLFIFITRPLNKFLAIVAVKWEKNKCRVVVYRMKYGKEWGRIECWTKAKLLPCGRKTVQRLEHWRYIDGLSNKKKKKKTSSQCAVEGISCIKPWFIQMYTGASNSLNGKLSHCSVNTFTINFLVRRVCSVYLGAVCSRKEEKSYGDRGGRTSKDSARSGIRRKRESWEIG